MKISEAIKSTWLELFGEKLDRSLAEGDKLIQVWHDIYAGRPEWQKYITRGLYGQRTEWRYLLNAAKLITSELSGLVFAEQPQLTIDKSVEELLEENKFGDNLQAWLDVALALGNGAMKWVVKDSKLSIDFVKAPDFLPVSYDSKGVTEADFASQSVINGKEFKIIERHRVAEQNGVPGYEISLKAFKRNQNGEYKACLASEAGIDENAVFFATSKPMFVFWKNPEANNIDIYSPLGISIYGNAVDTIRQLDEAYDNLAHERNSTKRKIIIGSSMISTVFSTAKQKQDVYYDRNDSVYVAFDDAEMKGMTPVDINFPFRIQEITADINANLSILCKQCGLSDNFLSFNGASMKTATEVVSENSKTFRTKKTIENSLTPVIESFLEVLKDIGGLYGVPTTDLDYEIKWDDSVMEDRGAKETRVIARYNAKLITLEDALKELDGYDDAIAALKAQAIREGNKTIDVGSMFGGNDSGAE